MAKKTDIVEYEPGTAVAWSPEVSRVMTGVFESPAKKRAALLVALGERKPRKKYKTAKHKKAAQKKKREERKKKKQSTYEQYGLTPRKRGPKMTEAEKKAKRSARGKRRRALFRDMARANPEKAKEFGIDITRFKL